MTRHDFAKEWNMGIKPHIDQLERVERWYERLQQAEVGSDEQLDFLFAFFTNCYHLRDFLEESDISQEKIAGLLKKHEMQICRDICNESKHCSLSRPSIYESQSDGQKDTGTFGGVVILRAVDLLHPDTPYWVVRVQGVERHEALELAHKCLTLWREFFSENKLR